MECEALSLPDHLARLCVDPSLELNSSAADVWYFDNLIEALLLYRTHWIKEAESRLANTEISRQISENLDFCYRRRRMILIEANVGVGKTATVKAWCSRYAGLVRYVETPSSNDDRSFYAAIAEAIGVARG